MILSDKTIRRMLAGQTLTITPITDDQIQPASVDIRLGNTFSVVEDTSAGIITMDREIAYKTIQTDRYLLLPGQFVLATTMEYFALPGDLTAFVEGRSSLGRMGLFIQNAGWVDPGFEGEITLELFNANRCAIELQAGRRVGQLVFAQMDSPAERPYRGKYQGQRGATGSRVFLDGELRAKPEYILETERLALRRMTQADYPALCRILQDKDVMYAYEHAFSDQEVQDWLDRQLQRYADYGFGLWLVELKKTGEVIGQCGLTMQELGSPERQALEIGYLFQKAYWHKGYATEAAAACKEYAFRVLGADSVCSIIRDNNIPSQNVAKRNGMVETERFTKHYYNMDMPHIVFSARNPEKDHPQKL